MLGHAVRYLLDATVSGVAMGLLDHVLRQVSCRRGLHRGRNFCAYCGKQLLPDPFSSFRLRSSDGQVDVVLKGINEHHAKWQLRSAYPPFQLTAQRVPDN